MKIKRLDFQSLRNSEHFQCHAEFVDLVKEFDAEALKIKTLFEELYLPLYKEADEAIFKIAKNTFTDARTEADRQRDITFRGMADMLKAALNHFDPAKSSAAKRLKIVFDAYGNVARLPLQEETAAIYNLLQELTEKYAADAQTVGLTEWAEKLRSDNQAYEELMKESYEEEAAKTELRMKEVRTTMDKAFRQMIERMEAFILIEGEADWSDFVRRLNVQLEKYANILAQRQGRNALNH